MTSVVLVARPRARGPVAQPTTCPECPARESAFCNILARSVALPQAQVPCLTEESRTVLARRILCREQDVLSSVPVICSGWALAAVMLSDGSRQILSFLLPGDLISAALLFDPKPNCFIEAITDVTYRAFGRAELKDLVFANPDLGEKLAQLWIEEKRRADEMIIDLGRRPASERIARLILGLFDRLQQRPIANGDAFEVDFPLRQHHIADAVGLTPVHVSKLLSELRRSGLIRLSERSLAILDPAGLRAVANVR